MANKFKQFTIKPNVLSSNGLSIDKVSLNIGTIQGTQGPQGDDGSNGTQGTQGTQGPQGNPQMQLTSPDGTVFQLTVDDSGVLGTTEVNTPIEEEESSPGESFSS